MKIVRLIPNTTAPNLEALGAHLVLAMGCKALDEALCYECPDQVADGVLEYRAAELYTPGPTFEAERAWLEAYKGTFEFYVSLKEQLARKGKLSPKQWASITKAVERDRQRASEPAKPFSIAPGTLIVVGKFIGQAIAELAGCSRPHYGMEVLEVLRETEKAYYLKLRLAAVRTSYCCVCGLTLKNPKSIALGIGPICGEHWGVDNEPDQLEAIAQKLRTYQEVVTWVPKKSIKERVEKCAPEHSKSS